VLSQDLSISAAGRNEDGSAVTGLHAGDLAWSSDGDLWACGMDVQARSRTQIAFFETNGLRHGELILPSLLPAPNAAAC